MATDDTAVWKALAEETRRSLLDALADGPRTTGDLVQLFPDLCRTAVMRHLDVLTDAGLVRIEREGRHRWNHLNPMPIQGIYERWVAPHLQRSAGLASRLKRQAEGGRARSDG